MTRSQPLAPNIAAVDAIRRRHRAPRFHVAVTDGRAIETAAIGDNVNGADLIRLASVSKMHTAAAAARVLAADGIGLDDTIGSAIEIAWIADLIPIPPDWLDQLTFAHLLGHTAGFRDVLSDERFVTEIMENPQRTWDPDELLRRAASYGPHLFRPGTGFAYSDTGYVVAGRLIERHTGRSLSELYRIEVFEPAHLDWSWFEPSDPLPSPVAPHRANGVDLTEVNTSFDWAGGGIVSTVADAAWFAHQFLAGDLVDPTTLERLTRPEPLAIFRPDSSAHYDAYGLGIGRIDLPTGHVHGATGAWGTFAVHDHDRSISLAGALGDADIDTHAVIADLHRHLTSEHP